MLNLRTSRVTKVRQEQSKIDEQEVARVRKEREEAYETMIAERHKITKAEANKISDLVIKYTKALIDVMKASKEDEEEYIIINKDDKILDIILKPNNGDINETN